MADGCVGFALLWGTALPQDGTTAEEGVANRQSRLFWKKSLRNQGFKDTLDRSRGYPNSCGILSKQGAQCAMNRIFISILVCIFGVGLAGALYFGGVFPAGLFSKSPSPPVISPLPDERGGGGDGAGRLPQEHANQQGSGISQTAQGDASLLAGALRKPVNATVKNASQNSTLQAVEPTAPVESAGAHNATASPEFSGAHNATAPAADAIEQVMASLTEEKVADKPEEQGRGISALELPAVNGSDSPDTGDISANTTVPQVGNATLSEPLVIHVATGEKVEGDSGVVRGKAGGPAQATARSDGSGATSATGGQAVVVRSRGDSMISHAFVNDFAQALVDGYWPQGTHPSARENGVVTTSLKWLNARYGAEMQGFTLEEGRTPEARHRLLRYALMPSMVQGLRAAYQEPLIEAMNAKARARTPGKATRTLTPHEIAEMYRIYSGLFGAMSGAVRAYYTTPDMENLVTKYITLEKQAHEAGTAYRDARFASGGAAVDDEISKKYQRLVAQREQAKLQVAAALRRGGDTRGLGTESLVYIASWLARRTPDQAAGLRSVGEAFLGLSQRFGKEAGVFAGLR